ncbi:hypothetical protein, partial [Streptococcus sp. 22.1]|uniref:hypothetical protein n=1 Tax=Streptococcus sp. 22.1 TaxID=2762565 RepID=UPI0021A39EC0
MKLSFSQLKLYYFEVYHQIQMQNLNFPRLLDLLSVSNTPLRAHESREEVVTRRVREKKVGG